jgi:glycosyltransferase involved in cell wall biosynthesis
MWMERRIFAQTAKVIALTEQGHQEVLAYGFKGPVTVIGNGADVKLFTPDSSVKKDVDVLFCGRIERRKGSRALVDLVKRLVLDNSEIKIAIVGYGDDDVYVNESLAVMQENVFLAGKVPFAEMINFYNRSKVYASTSYYEGLPGTCLEAMSMELPVVVWDFLFYRGLVEEGVTGFYIKPNDISAFSAQVQNLLARPDLAAEAGKKGRLVIQNSYGWSSLAKQVLEVFQPN